MLRDSKGRFCKANKTNVKSTKIPFLNPKHEKKEELEWADVGNNLFGDEINEPIILHIKIKDKDRFDDCVNNACIFDRLDWDERAKFMETLCNDGKRWAGICDTMSETCTIAHPIPLKDGSGCRIASCNGCFTDWFFNYYDPEVFHKILGD